MEIVTVEPGQNNLGAELTADRQLQDASRAATPKSEIKPLDDAELDKRRQSIVESMGWEKPKEEPATPVETPADAAPAVPASPPVEVPAEPIAPVVTPAAPAAKTDKPVEEIIAATAKAVGDEVTNAIRREEPTIETPSEPLSPEDTEAYGIIQKMEELGTAKRGTAEAFKEFAFARYAYMDKWEKANPSRTFDPNDSEHEEFYKGQPQIDDDRYEEAKVALRVDRTVEDRVNKALAPIREKAVMEESKVLLATAVQDRIVQMIKAVSPDLAAVAVVNGRLDLSADNIAKITDSDPIAASVLEPMLLEELRPLVIEIEKTTIPGLNYRLDPSRNRVHADIADYVGKLEQKLSKSKETRGGKRFITIADYNARLSEIQAMKSPAAAKKAADALDREHYYVGPDDIETFIVETLSERASKQIQQIDSIAARKYKKDAKPAAPKTDAQPSNTPAPIPAPATVPARPPSMGSQTDAVDARPNNQAAAKNWGETAVKTHFS